MQTFIWRNPTGRQGFDEDERLGHAPHDANSVLQGVFPLESWVNEATQVQREQVCVHSVVVGFARLHRIDTQADASLYCPFDHVVVEAISIFGVPGLAEV
ncbi:MAG: hypothetical protein PHR35_19725 [Kiritimatiellae bacterium]|nr:hypothetical protein [Kiritimatiellia bacterium]